MIELTKRMAVIGAVNEILLDMEKKQRSFQDIYLTPQLVNSYVHMLEIRSGFLVSKRFTTKSLEQFFQKKSDLFQKNENGYRLRIENLISSRELSRFRSAPLSHSCVASIITQMMDALNEKCKYPLGFLKGMQIHDYLLAKKP